MTAEELAAFNPWLASWRLVPDGRAIRTAGSLLLPVRQGAAAAMLKVPREDEERRGSALLAWWAGEGAAPVLDFDGTAILLERAMGQRSLEAMALGGSDDEASTILCAVAGRLHARRGEPAGMTRLPQWFRALAPAAASQGGILGQSAQTARELLADPREETVLHGDLHHGNVLDFGDKGWLAIDPKGLIGERGYDFANMLCNPIGGHARSRERFARQVSVIAAAASLERTRLLSWVLAYAGLSAAWTLADGGEADHALTMARLAAEGLG